jgi:hypothetical protein
MDGERKEVPFATSKSAPPEGSKLSVFISYSRDDLAFADQLAAGLTLGGFEPTIDRSGISGGEDWKLRLGALIRNAETVVFVLSPASAQSPICKWEVEEAVRLGKRIIPVPCRPLEGVAAPPQLAGLNYIFFYDEPRSPGSGFGTGLVRLVSALNTDVEWLHEHTRLLQRASEWQAAGRAESRLLFGDSIVEAKTWAETRPKDAPEPTALHYEFIRASEDAEARRQSIERQRLEERERLVRDAEVAQYQRDAAARRVVQRTLFGLVVAIVLALVAGGFGIYALQQRKEAEVQGRQAVSLKEQAEAEAKRARTARDEALLTQSRYLADVSRSVLEQDKDPGTAMLLALEALPDKASDDEAQRDRPYWAPAEVSLEASRRLLRERFILKGDAEDVTCVSISPDGTRIASGLVIRRSNFENRPIGRSWWRRP